MASKATKQQPEAQRGTSSSAGSARPRSTAQNTGRNGSGNTRSAAGRTAETKKNSRPAPPESTGRETESQEAPRTDSLLIREALLWIVIAVGIFLFISYFGFGGLIGGAVSDISFGIFGWPAYLLPFFLVLSIAFLVSNKGNRIAKVKFVSAVVLYLTVSCFFGLARAEEYSISSVSDIYEKSAAVKGGGGAVGGTVTRLLTPALGTAGTAVFLIILSVICLILITQRSLMRSVKHQSSKMYRSAKEESARRREAHEEEQRIRRESVERTYVPVEDRSLTDESSRSRWDVKTDRLPGGNDRAGSGAPSDRTKHSQTQRRQARHTSQPQIPDHAERPESQVQNSFVIEGADRSSGTRKEIEVPVIYPSEPSERRIRHKGTGVTEDTYIPKENDSSLSGRSEVREIVPNLRQERPSAPEISDVPDSAEASVQAGDMEELSLQIEGLQEESDPIDTRRTAQTERHGRSAERSLSRPQPEAAPELLGTAARSSAVSARSVSIFADENSGGNTSAGTVFTNSGKPAESDAASAGRRRSIRTETADAVQDDAAAQAQPAEPHASSAPKRNPRSSEQEIQDGIADVQAQAEEKAAEAPKKEYVFPPIDLLTRGSARSGAGQEQEVRQTAAKLQATLDSFGVRAKVTNVSCGPTVTRYELMPEQGVKVKQIVALSDDIKLNLAATDIRIEAPIPGKSAVGIEVPNQENSVVKLRDLIDSEEFRGHKSNLAFAVGKDIGGKTVVTDIAKMPHLLIAGATGSGKSVCINTLIMSLLYKADPDDVKLIMIDPKVVELSVYNGIPHLFIPVVTDPKKAAGALNWAVAEMDDRYQKFAEYGVRDLKGYNQRVEALKDVDDPNKPKKLPQIVIIVDELADLMMVAPGEVEDSICRLAQLARAAGLHLIIATQRPSVNVITGLIKANMPSRIAFSVSSGIDSRTILDMYGAEKLLGKGDMLFYPQGYSKPARVQGAFVSDEEVSDVVDFLKEQNSGGGYDTQMEEQLAKVQQAGAAAARNEDVDALFADAGKFIIEKDKASIGMLQRVFKIGFNRAARIMDQLSDAGIVGPEEGTKPRKILMSMEEFENYLEQN